MRERSKQVWKRYRLSISTLIIQVIACVHIALSFFANSDFTKRPELLSQGEKISYEGIHNIFHSGTLSQFFYNVLVGTPQYYGRIFFNLAASVAVVPTFLLGDSGQILATRMLFAAVLAISYLLLVFSFLQRSVMRIFCFAILTFLPTSFFLSTLPRPEALQLLFVVGFIALYFRMKTRHPFQWILLGLALGTDPGTLPLVAFFLAIDVYQSDRNQQSSVFFFSLMKRIAFLLSGAFIATPVIGPNLFLGEGFSQIWPPAQEQVLLGEVHQWSWQNPRALAIWVYLLGLIPTVFFLVRLVVNENEPRRSLLMNESLQLFLLGFLLNFFQLYGHSNDSLVSIHLSLVLILVGVFHFLQKRQLRWLLVPGLALLLFAELVWSFRHYELYTTRSKMSPITRQYLIP